MPRSQPVRSRRGGGPLSAWSREGTRSQELCRDAPRRQDVPLGRSGVRCTGGAQRTSGQTSMRIFGLTVKPCSHNKRSSRSLTSTTPCAALTPVADSAGRWPTARPGREKLGARGARSARSTAVLSSRRGSDPARAPQPVPDWISEGSRRTYPTTGTPSRRGGHQTKNHAAVWTGLRVAESTTPETIWLPRTGAPLLCRESTPVTVAASLPASESRGISTQAVAACADGSRRGMWIGTPVAKWHNESRARKPQKRRGRRDERRRGRQRRGRPVWRECHPH